MSDARSIPCPKCNAAVGAICVRKDKHPYRKNGKIARHVERIRAWNALGRPKGEDGV